jgi:hypothetical protein
MSQMPEQREYSEPSREILYEEDPARMADPVLAFFHDYWKAKRGSRTVPRAKDFVPKEVRAYLRWIVIADALPDYSDFRYRIVGTSVCEYFLADGTGKTVSEAFAGMEELARGVIRIYARTCQLEKPIRYAAPATVVNGIFFPTFDALYLPFSTTGANADRMISAFVFNYRALQSKRPLSLHSLKVAEPARQ